MSKISPGTIIVGIFAVLFGLVGAYAIRQQLMQKPVEVAKAPEPPRPVMVPIAAIDLEPGRPLTLGDVAILRMMPDELEAHGIKGPYMRDSAQIIGRIPRSPVAKGTTFFPEMFYPQGLGPSIAERLKPGYRAVTVPIEDDAAVAGMATPGSLVDVIFRTSAKQKDDAPETTITLLEGVEVLALGKVATPGAQVGNDSRRNNDLTVTLAVSPNQANALRVVDGRGELSLSMRNPQDHLSSSEVEPQTLAGLLGLPQPHSFVTEVYRGNDRRTVTFVNPAPQSFQLKHFPVRAEVQQPTDLQGEPAPASQDDAGKAAATAPAASPDVRLVPVSLTESPAPATLPARRVGLSGLPLDH